MTGKDAAEALGIKPPYLYALEGGKKQPSSKLIEQIGQLYGRPVAFFLRDDQQMVMANTNS